MANNEEISPEVKVEETRPVSAEKETFANTNSIEPNEVENSKDVKSADEKAKVVKNEKADKSKKKKSKDKNPNKMAKRLKETSSELKKVTWPTFGTVVKKTGVVLLVAALFLLVVFGIDRLCSWLIGFVM